MKNSRLETDYKNYKQKCQEINSLIRERKENYNSTLIDNLDESNTNSKEYYSLIKKFLGNKYPSNIPTLFDPVTNKHAVNSNDKACTFLNIFSKKYHQDVIRPIPQNFQNRTNAILDKVETNPNEILKYLKNLDVSKACGPDNITNRMLKLSADSLCVPLSQLINKIFDCKKYPANWKIGIIVPLHKKDKKDNPNNYRPVTLLSTISKICEKVIFDRMFDHIDSHNLLYEQQSGFIKGHSTHDQLLAIVHYLHENIESGKSVKAVFLDITAAFDSVPHNLLLHKLKSYGFQGSLLELINSYLHNRKVQVRVRNSLSELTKDNYINAGVAQGSLLGPLMFLLYINDLPDNISSNMFLYADDSSIYRSFDHNNFHNPLLELQNDLEKIAKWSQTWGLDFKASKSWDVTFHSANKKPPVTPLLTLNNSIIPKTATHKHLGVILDENLNFKAHIDDLSRRYQNMVNTLRALSGRLPSKHLNKIYNTYIISILDHGDILYSSSTEYQLSRLERIHYRAACAVSGAMRGSSTSKVLENLNWSTLRSRRDYHAGNYMFKAFNHHKPAYVCNILDKYKNNQGNERLLRNTRLFKFPNSASSRFLNSPSVQLMKNFDNLSNDLKYSESFSIFKANLKKQYFSITNNTSTTSLNLHRSNEILINRLRVGLLLNAKRYSHNFLDTPSPACRCGHHYQDESHIFFNCTLVTHHRRTLLRSLAELDMLDRFDHLNNSEKIKLLLYGDITNTFEINRQIILATSKFLFSSKFIFKHRT